MNCIFFFYCCNFPSVAKHYYKALCIPSQFFREEKPSAKVHHFRKPRNRVSRHSPDRRRVRSVQERSSKTLCSHAAPSKNTPRAPVIPTRLTFWRDEFFTWQFVTLHNFHSNARTQTHTRTHMYTHTHTRTRRQSGRHTAVCHGREAQTDSDHKVKVDPVSSLASQPTLRDF